MKKIEKVEQYLKTGKILTKDQAYQWWRYMNLGDAILKLRAKYGVEKIKTNMVRTGDTIHAEYKMINVISTK